MPARAGKAPRTLYDMACAPLDVVRDLATSGGKWKKGKIHDMRIAIRRLKGTLELAQMMGINVEIPRPLEKSFKRLGKARDLDQSISIIGELNHSDHQKATIHHLKQNRKKKRKQLFTSHIYMYLTKTCSEFAAMIENEFSAKPLALPSMAKLAKESRNFRDLLNDVSSDMKTLNTDDKSLHKFRIKIKRARYLLECLTGVPRSLLERLQDRQAVLGELHDIQVVRKKASRQGAGKRIDKALRERLDAAKARALSAS